MRFQLLLAALVLGCLGCEFLTPPTTASAPNRERRTRAGSASVSPGPTAKPAGVSASRKPVTNSPSEMTPQDAILEAIQNTFAIGEVGRNQATMNLVSNNGGGLISNNGGGVLIGGRTRYEVAQTAPTGDFVVPEDANARDLAAGQTGPNGEIAKYNRRSDPDYVYHIYFYKPDFRGEIFALPRALHEALAGARGKATVTAAELAASYTEHYFWDAPKLKFLGSAYTPPMDALITYPLKVVKTRRVKITKAMNLYVEALVSQLMPSPKLSVKGLTADFVMEVPLVTGGTEGLTMLADTFTYQPGQSPAETGTFFGPISFKAHGSNTRGALEMLVENLQSDPSLTSRITGTYTRFDGRKATRAILTHKDGRTEDTVVDVDTGVQAVFGVAADASGSGVVKAASSGEKLGDVTWNAEGLATVTFTDGAVRTIHIF